MWLGVTEHRFDLPDEPIKVLRFFDKAGRLLPTRAEQEAAARKAAEAELARLRALLAGQDDGISS